MRNSDVHGRAVDASLIVDHKIAFLVADDVEDAAQLTLEVLDLIAADIEIDHSYGFSGICRNYESVHASGWNTAVIGAAKVCLTMTNAGITLLPNTPGQDGQVFRLALRE
jgi:hypothetical protein